MEKYKARPNGMDNDNLQEKTESEKKQESTEKAVDLAAETALDYFTGGQGSKIKNAIGNVPIVGNKVNQAWDGAVKKLSGVVSKTPAGDVLKAADDLGVTDAARTAKDAINVTKGDSNNVNAIDNKNQLLNTKSSSSNNDNSFLTGNIMNFAGKGFKMKLYIFIGIGFFFLLILVTILSGKDAVNLSSTNNSTMTPSVSSNINVNISQGGGTLMTDGQSLLVLLGQEKIDLWNNKIKNDVSSGIGTGYGPAIAAYDLIQGAFDEGLTLPYLWGGGHDSVSNGINPNWGANVEVTSSGSEFQEMGSTYPDGLDNSGFVSWALINGGCSDFNVLSSSQFSLLGNLTDSNNAKVGDIAANSSHVMIILENTGSTLLVAEAKDENSGIIFSEYTYEFFDKYNVMDMTNYYATNCKG